MRGRRTPSHDHRREEDGQTPAGWRLPLVPDQRQAQQEVVQIGRSRLAGPSGARRPTGLLTEWQPRAPGAMTAGGEAGPHLGDKTSRWGRRRRGGAEEGAAGAKVALRLFGGVRPAQPGQGFLPRRGHLGPTAPELDEQQRQLLRL